MSENISGRLALLLNRIRRAEMDYGREPRAVRLLAISKTRPVADICEAYAAGQVAFGESYVQEAMSKIQVPELHHAKWHFVGPMQSNKAAKISRWFAWVHSLDRMKVAELLDRNRMSGLPPLNVCVQVNISKEKSKSGVPRNEVGTMLEAVARLPRLKLRGLMAIPRKPQNERQGRSIFAELGALYHEMKGDFSLDTLSMGMSFDYLHAIAEGATIVRIGTALFGRREPSQ